MVKQIITDEESILKRQARRRLIGAIALTILVVILLPMLLDSEPPKPSPDIDLQIPDKDKAGEFLPKMVLPPQDASKSASQPASAPLIAPLLDTKPLDAAVPPAHIEAKPAVQPAPKNALVPEAVHKPAVQKTEAKPVAKPAANAASKSHTGYVLQVGAFSHADAAKNLQDKLHKQGYPSYTEKAGDKVRVRIGDYSAQEEAEKIRRKLEIQGYHPNVIKLK
ncbi:MAG: SPOR domain-containing protein [Gallionellaceae bacterium]|jgi:DedD protein